MKVAYIFTQEELSALWSLLIDQVSSEKVFCEHLSCKQSLIKKKFIHYELEQLKIDPVIALILKEMSIADKVNQYENKKIYQGEKIVLEICSNNHEMKIQVFDIELYR